MEGQKTVKDGGGTDNQIRNRVERHESLDRRLHVLGDYNADNYMRSGNAFYSQLANHQMQEVRIASHNETSTLLPNSVQVSAISDTPIDGDMVERHSDHVSNTTS